MAQGHAVRNLHSPTFAMAEKILVIDDHAETLNLVSVILKRQGYEVHTAGSGPVGLNLAEQVDPNLILLDVMMPEMDGYEVCRRLRSHITLYDIPIILFTAKSQPGEKWEGFQAGATDYLVKPTNTEELGKRVRMILDQSPRRQKEAADSSRLQTTVVSPLPDMHSHMVGVLGVRGGVGTTTTAVNLAFCLAQASQETILADLDVAQGHVGVYLNSKISESLNALATADANYLAGELSAQIASHSENLRLLLSKPNAHNQRPTLEAAQMPFVAEALQRLGGHIVLDLGHGLTSFNQPIIEQLDQLVICLRPERVAISAAKQVLSYIGRVLPSTAKIHILMLEFGQGSPLPRKAVENFIGAELDGELTISTLDMLQAVNSAKPLVQSAPTAEATRIFRKLAHQLIPAR
jgi:DNA-binding response OmpR family regulator